MNAMKVTFGWPESARTIMRQVLLSVVICTIVPVGSVGALILAESADDVCAPTDDPCRITEVVKIGRAAVLDFGTRTVEVTNDGQLDFGGTWSWPVRTVLCGDLIVNSGKKAGIKVRENNWANRARIEARRACSGDTAIACLDDATCSAVGAGSCSVGEGRIDLNGTHAVVQGSAEDEGGNVTILAAGDIVVGGSILLNVKGRYYAYGSDLKVKSFLGSVTIDGPISVNVHTWDWWAEEGGTVFIDAGVDVIVNEPVRTVGTDGEIDIEAGRDLVLESQVNATPQGGITLRAGNDIKVGASGTYVALLAPGFEEGGAIELSAGGDVFFGRRTLLNVRSRLFEAGYISVVAGGDVALNGRISANGTGYSSYWEDAGIGGQVRVDAGGNLTVGRKGRITALSHPAGFGPYDILIDLRAGANITHEGRISASGGFELSKVIIVAGGDAAISGSIKNKINRDNGNDTVLISVEACRLELRDRGRIRSRATGSASAENILTGRERITLFPKSKLMARSGVNRLIYRDIIKPPQIAGRQYPAVELVVDWLMAGCPVCGNGEIDQGETCDDGNTTDGDGCSSTCQIEP